MLRLSVLAPALVAGASPAFMPSSEQQVSVEVRMRLFTTTSASVGQNLKAHLKTKLGFTEAFAESFLDFQRNGVATGRKVLQWGKEVDEKLTAYQVVGMNETTDTKWVGIPAMKAPASVTRDTTRGLVPVFEYMMNKQLDGEEVTADYENIVAKCGLEFEVPSAEYEDSAEYVEPVPVLLRDPVALKACARRMVGEVQEINHLSYQLTGVKEAGQDWQTFTPGYEGIRRTANNWKTVLESPVPAARLGLTDEVKAMSVEEAIANLKTEGRVIEDDVMNAPSIYHKTRDVVKSWSDKLERAGKLTELGLTGPAATFTVPGIPPFFASDDCGIEYENADGEYRFLRTETYGDFMGNQENDGGAHISLFNRVPSENAILPGQAVYEVPVWEQTRAVLDKISAGGDLKNIEILGHTVAAEIEFELDLTAIKIVNGGQRNDRGTGGVSYVGAVIPKKVSDEKIRPMLNLLGMRPDASQQFHISLSLHAPSWVPHFKSPQRIPFASLDINGENSHYWLFRRGDTRKAGAFKANQQSQLPAPLLEKSEGNIRGFSANVLTGWEDYEQACNMPTWGLPAFGQESNILPFLGFKASIERDADVLKDGLTKSAFNAAFNPKSIFNGVELAEEMARIESSDAETFVTLKRTPLNPGRWKEPAGPFGALAKGPAKQAGALEDLDGTPEGLTSSLGVVNRLMSAKKAKTITPKSGSAKETKVLASEYIKLVPDAAEQELMVKQALKDFAMPQPKAPVLKEIPAELVVDEADMDFETVFEKLSIHETDTKAVEAENKAAIAKHTKDVTAWEKTKAGYECAQRQMRQMLASRAA